MAHFMEKLSFGSTAKFESADRVASALEPYGGITEALHFRDVGVYTVSCLPDGLDTATDVLSQVTPRTCPPAASTLDRFLRASHFPSLTLFSSTRLCCRGAASSFRLL